MTPEEHKMLAEVREATLQNTQILMQIRRGNRVALCMRILYWVVILGISFGAFYFAQPYIDTLKDTYSGLSGL